MVHSDNDRPAMAAFTAEEEGRRAEELRRHQAAFLEPSGGRPGVASRVIAWIRRILDR